VRGEDPLAQPARAERTFASSGRAQSASAVPIDGSLSEAVDVQPSLSLSEIAFYASPLPRSVAARGWVYARFVQRTFIFRLVN
jgi:hypothetical protein